MADKVINIGNNDNKVTVNVTDKIVCPTFEGTATKVGHKLSFGNKTFDGSSTVILSGTDLGSVDLTSELTIIGLKTFSGETYLDSLNTNTGLISGNLRVINGIFGNLTGNVIGNLSGNASTATKLQTARTLTIGNTGKSFDGSSNVSWTLSEIGAASSSHTHNYLPLSGGTVTGQLYLTGLEEGTADVTDNTELLTSYASNNGFSETNATGKVYKRDVIHVYNYIKNKLDSVYSAIGHTHSYLPLSGGTMTGNISFSNNSKISWSRNTDFAEISFKNDGDADSDSYMLFLTADNGNEYFKWNHYGSTEDWMNLKSSGLSVLGTVTSSGFKKSNSSDSYVLLGGGGHKSLSDFLASGNYAGSDTNGGKAYYSYKLYYPSTSYITTKTDLDDFLESYIFKARLWNGTNAEDLLGTSYPGAGNGIILSGGWSSTSYGFLLAIDDDPNYFIALRQRGNGTWSTWKRIPMGDGTGASGTWNISITGTAGTATNVAWSGVTNKPNFVNSFGTKTGNITIRGGQTGNGSVNLTMSNNELLASIVGLGSNAYTSTAYLPLAGGTLNSGANIIWRDRGAWSDSSATYPYSYGGLYWSGTSDSIKIYGKEELSDLLNLWITFGDDSGHAIKIDDCGNVYTVYHTGNLSPMTTSHPANGITADNIKNWNAVYNWYSVAADNDGVNDAINTWKEVESFLSGVTDLQTLTGLLSTRVAKSGGTMSGTLIISGVSTGNWTEGIRINNATNGWTTLTLGGTVNSGTRSNIWSLHTFNSNFYINNNGSDDLKATRLWGHSNGYTIGNTSISSNTLAVGGTFRVTSSITGDTSISAGTTVTAATSVTSTAGDFYVGGASGSRCHIKMDTTNKCIKFIFD